MTEQEIAALKIVRQQLTISETRLFEQVAATFRWLMATLFAANGGAIVALLNWDDLNLLTDKVPLAWFAGGLLLSILMGMLSGFFGYQASTWTISTGMRIDQSLIEGVLDERVLPDLIAKAPTWKTWFPSYAGVASFACLTIGILSFSI